ncbi:MAG: hypothetical protein ACRDE5_13190, partial [Ginsengibacter sp.]
MDEALTNATNPRPLFSDFNSLSKLTKYLHQHGRGTRKLSVKSHANYRGSNGLGILYIALDTLRKYAYPGDQPEWSATQYILKTQIGVKRLKHFKPRITASPGFWKFNGPKDLGGGTSDVSGRLSAIAVDPTNSNILYVGAPAGGVWKSIDGGVSWNPLSNSWPFEAISSIAIDPKNTNVIYVGTGDFQAWSRQSFGLMKSVDGGSNFTNLAINEAGEFSISSIAIDPDQTNIITITTGRGRQGYGQVWRSVDGGQNWGANPAIPEPAEWAEVVISKQDDDGTRYYYAVGWNLSGGIIYRSGDRGVNWDALNVPWGAGQYGISIAPSVVNAKTVYLLAGSDKKVLSSPDTGNTWTDITGDLTQVPWDWNQLWYD